MARLTTPRAIGSSAARTSSARARVGSGRPLAGSGIRRAPLGNEAVLRQAIVRREISCSYQPIVELESGTFVGAEALVRWRHPSLGDLLPAAFLADAEETGVIALLGRFVLDEACAEASSWRVGARGRIPVSVNVSPLQLTSGSLVDDVQHALDRSGLRPDALVLELTESRALPDLDDAASQLRALRERGVSVSLDDLGSGYSSLLRLVRLPVDEVKIDGALVDRVCDGTHAAAVVRSIVALAEALGIEVVAEQVETAAQRACLLELGCRRGQGFHFARPMSSYEIDARIGRGVVVRRP